METDENNPNLTRKERIELRRQERKNENENGRKSSTRRFIVWLIAVAVIGGGVFGIIKLAQNSGQSASGSLYAAVGVSDWIAGNKEAKTVLVEYSDYECPACALFYTEVKNIVDQNRDRLEFVYRNFPLSQHKNAALAAYSAEAAGKQGKFWEMQDKLFTNQISWSEKDNAREIFFGYANDLGLNIGQFKNDIDSQAIKDKVDADYQSGFKSGVGSTPTFFLNGSKIVSFNSLDEFRSIIQQSIDVQ